MGGQGGVVQKVKISDSGQNKLTAFVIVFFCPGKKENENKQIFKYVNEISYQIFESCEIVKVVRVFVSILWIILKKNLLTSSVGIWTME